ncbi:DUF4334 domain-containing protein [Nocardia thailandica]|uniref:DUF4334 domain-containing protein n=1 Tax=Nocardia thailandica TaxID=257275 RepID=A0ABW6PRA7_9NOCA|nr:DUF4334 domain-containing protein [Nocardia thailandica]
MTTTELTALEPACTREQALALFDRLPAVSAAELTGRWHGRELATGHPMDGLLDASGWYGKQFDGPDSVHPLLFGDPSAGIYAVDPRRIPLGLADRAPAPLVARGRGLMRVLEPALRTRRYRARLRDIEFRGEVTAAMIYDHLPIIDVFRRVDETTLLGLMDFRDRPAPYFFILERD